ncbi:MAG: hypothetical protein WD749_10135 [Phycisphaerales bacterium]
MPAAPAPVHSSRPDHPPPAAPLLRAARALAVLCFAALVPLWVASTAPPRGPAYLWFNTDSPYAYLLNSLRVAEGHSPWHTDHPGTPLQVLGAATLLTVHAFEPGTPLRDAVLADPERSLGHIRVAMTGVIALLSLAGGALALRATGSVAHAAAVQATPFIAWSTAMMLDRVQVEAPLIGLATVFSGACLMVIHRPPGFRARRAAIVLGLITATGVSTKLLFAPLALVPLVALGTMRLRALYLASAALFLALWVLPIALHLPRMLAWLGGIATHTGRYGAGESAVLDPAAYPGQLAQICAGEPIYPVIALGALAVGAPAAFFLRRRLGSLTGRVAASLLAASVAQLALLAVVGKHPAVHYLTAGVGVAGLSLSLGASLAASVSPAALRRAGAVALIVVVAGLGCHRWAKMLRWRPYATSLASREALVVDFLRSPEGEGVLRGAQTSTVEAALHFGNMWAGRRYADDLRRLYPGVLIWDRAGPAAFGRAPSAEESRRMWEGGSLRALAPRFFGPEHFRLSGLSIVAMGEIGGQRYIRAFPSPVVPAGTPDFAGFTPVSGLGGAERSTQGGEAWEVRWGLGEASRVRFESTGGPLLLIFEARPNNQRGQSVEVLIDGRAFYAHRFATREFELHSLLLHAGPGEHALEFRYGSTELVRGRSLSVLFKRLQVVPAPR